MNFNLFGVVALSAGVILMYSAVVDANPMDVIQNALSGKKTPKKSATTKPAVMPDPPHNDGTKVVSV